ncbi:hypothetical protein ACFQZE_16885 [Paenibacillus sp. GCM10027627]
MKGELGIEPNKYTGGLVTANQYTGAKRPGTAERPKFTLKIAVDH